MREIHYARGGDAVEEFERGLLWVLAISCLRHERAAVRRCSRFSR